MSSNSLNSVQILSSKAQQILNNLKTNGISDFQQLDQSAIDYWNDIAGYINDHPINAQGNVFSGTQLNLYNKNRGYAEGGDVPRTDIYTVGERGPEKVVLPGGAHVYPHGVEPGGYSSAMTQAPLQGWSKQPVIENHTHIYLDSQEIAHYAGDQQARMVRLHQARRVA